ncbi:methionyl-tRNA formyltransferase [Arthrobacter agilis]|uniref:methionyl-tRNA formyltransferase n=1 Tax=Arthrobacter agilis TaxID=37921 RepID=UPI000B364304|nr:methionyl-tRNA formyltransferase [Arthrobacter agilis]OUM45261.1 methionyl-tRNA formyltransferase [Arthrobacter agilis]PPB47476.1 methionyl-tRNA formyltransferase [Arthrobacter agilis]TPV21747.1 methionyl-tRNA formyltransferase [Arthrobacter agilis]VDR32197.1 Methionyl-tRNA formyltransferase [Arthrobacter agilis]
MRILFAGTPEVAVPSLRALVEAGFDVAAVLTRVDAPLGRKRVLTPSPVAAAAADLGLPVLKANRFTPELLADLTSLELDAAAIVAYGGIVPPAGLRIPQHGWINLHFSVLPAWRGAAPVQHAVLAGDDVTGASTFLLEEGLDTGPVFGVMTETLDPASTSGEVLERLSHSGAVLLVQTLSGLEAGRVAATPQQGEPTLAPKLTIDDARIDWTQPAVAVRRRINAVTPEPGAWTMLDGQRVKVAPVAPAAVPPRTDDPTADGTAPGSGDGAGRTDLPPGGLVVEGRRVLVGTGSHPVQLDRVQPAGKKMMSALDWARGAGSRGELVFE